MRTAKKIALGTAGGILGLAIGAFGLVQTGPGKRFLAGTIEAAASSPGMRLTLSGLRGFVPTDLSVDRIEIADKDGTWLSVDDARLRWSFASLFTGRVRIETVGASQVSVVRGPRASEPPPPPSASPPTKLQLPVGIDLQNLSVGALRLGPDLARVESIWQVDGSALLPADLSAGQVRLSGVRKDGPEGSLKIDTRFDAGRGNGEGEIVFEEGKGGLAAIFLERPDLERLTARLVARGDARAGDVELTLSAGDAANGTGKATWRPRDAATEVSVRLETRGPGLPAGAIADALRGPIVLTADAVIDDAAATLSAARLTAGTLELASSGRYDRKADKLAGTLSLRSPEPGTFSALAGGIAWRGLELDATADIADFARAAVGSIDIKGKAEQIDATVIDPRIPPPGPVTLAARIGVRGEDLEIESLDVRSSVAEFAGTGTYATRTARADAKATLTLPSLAPFSALAGRELSGRGAVDLDVVKAADGLSAEWRGRLRDLHTPGLPGGAVPAEIGLSGKATLAPDGKWVVRDAEVAGDTGKLTVNGEGSGAITNLDLALDLPRLGAFREGLAGAAAVKSTIGLRPDGTDIRLSADLTGLREGTITAGRVAATTEASIDKNGAVRGNVKVDGDLDARPLRLEGAFARNAAGELTVPSLQGSWAGAVLDVANLVVAEARTSGRARLKIDDLREAAAPLGLQATGRLQAEVNADPNASAGRLDINVEGADIATSGVAVGSLSLTGYIEDPLGAARTDLTFAADRLAGTSGVGAVKATAKGDRAGLDVDVRASGATSANVLARVEMAGEEIVVALRRLDARYSNIPVVLAGPSRLRIAGARVSVDPTTLRLGSGRATLQGVVDPAASDLRVDLAALPLALVDAVAPGTGLEGTLNARVRVQGAMAAPRIDASYDAAGLRIRRPDATLVPPLALRGTATLAGADAAYDLRISAAGATALTVKGKATLPQGRSPLAATAAIAGAIDIAPFSPLLGNDIRNVSGTLRPDLTVEVAGGRVNGRGSIAFANGALALPDAGLRLSGGEGRLLLQGDTVRFERFSFSTAGGGTVNVGGNVRLDETTGPILDLTVTSRRALLVSRPDLVATISSDVKIQGGAPGGIDVSGPIVIDRAEIRIGGAQAAAYPTLDVREINRPGAPPVTKPAAGKPAPKPAPPPSATPIRLALDISAPQAVFVRGRGLEAEMSGRLQVGGTPAAPTAIGGLTLRRGEFSLGGRQLTFSRGIVTLDNLNTIDPRLDFVASTNVQSATVGIAITGTARAPSFAITSTPAMPSDEAMALLIFGRPASSLGASELLQVAAAVAELAGESPATGVLGRLRQGLGLDRLNVGTSGSGSSSSGSNVSIEAGRYVAPGVYVGARQGAAGNSSRGVVQLEVLDNVKIEGDIGADSNGRVGVKMEWDY